jgi:MerR family redox-sensitive transcriptional activator SoxR
LATSRQLLSIGEVSAAARLRPSALRYYEEVGLIQPSARIGGRRHYRPTILRRLAIIALCQTAGFTVSEIAQFLGSGSRARAKWRKLAERKLEELNANIERANTARRLVEQALACGCADPADCGLVREAVAHRLHQIEARPATRRGPAA